MVHSCIRAHNHMVKSVLTMRTSSTGMSVLYVFNISMRRTVSIPSTTRPNTCITMTHYNIILSNARTSSVLVPSACCPASCTAHTDTQSMTQEGGARWHNCAQVSMITYRLSCDEKLTTICIWSTTANTRAGHRLWQTSHI